MDGDCNCLDLSKLLILQYLEPLDLYKKSKLRLAAYNISDFVSGAVMPFSKISLVIIFETTFVLEPGIITAETFGLMLGTIGGVLWK